MKISIILFLSLLSINIFAQSRGTTLQNIRSISESVRNETFNSQANLQNLLQAQELLEQAYALVANVSGVSDILCSRDIFGYIPTNSATGMSYGENISTLSQCQRLLPPRGAFAMCAKARFGYQPIELTRGIFIGESSFSDLGECLALAPAVAQKVMCAKDRFGYRPYSLSSLMGLGENVSNSQECLRLLPEPGSNLMCVKDRFGYQAINIVSGRSFGQRTPSLEECHRTIRRD